MNLDISVSSYISSRGLLPSVNNLHVCSCGGGVGGVEGCCHAWGDQGGGGQGLVKGLVCWLDRTKLGWFFLLINQFVFMNIICFTFCGDKYDEGSQVESKNGHHLLKAFYPPEKKRQQKLTNSKRVISSPIWKILWVGRCWHLFYCDDFSQISPLFHIWEEKMRLFT